MMNDFYDESGFQTVKFHHLSDEYICLLILIFTWCYDGKGISKLVTSSDHGE